jgi:2-oxoglutarate dehydrogenase complex, dehydrogenase (E1) component, and related enzymes
MEMPTDLEPAYYGLAEPDMDTIFDTDSLYGVDKLPLRKIIAILKEIYCGSIGSEYMHIMDADTVRWIKNKLEGKRLDSSTHSDEKKNLLIKVFNSRGRY